MLSLIRKLGGMFGSYACVCAKHPAGRSHLYRVAAKLRSSAVYVKHPVWAKHPAASLSAAGASVYTASPPATEGSERSESAKHPLIPVPRVSVSGIQFI